MKIKDLPEPVRTWAIRNLEAADDSLTEEDDLSLAFPWGDSPEGIAFWSEIDNECESLDYFKNKYFFLPWEGDFIKTDNSKVNENLLKENESLKAKLERLKEIVYSDLTIPVLIDNCQIYLSETERMGVNAIFENMQTEFFNHKVQAGRIIKELDPLVKEELKKLLNND